MKQPHYKVSHKITVLESKDNPGKKLVDRLIDDSMQTNEIFQNRKIDYQQVFDTLCIPLIHYDLNGVLLLANNAAAESLGHKRDELINKSLWDIFDKSSCECILQKARDITEMATNVECEAFLNLTTGSRWFLSQLQPIYDKNRSVVGIQIIAHDITARKKTEQTLRKHEELLRTIVSTVNESIMCIDDSGRVTLVNPAAERMFGLDNDEIVGRRIDLLFPGKYRKRLAKNIESFLLKDSVGHATGKVLELQAYRKNGEVFSIDMSLSTGKISNQQVIVCVLRDISERKNAEEKEKSLQDRLARAERMESLGLLAGGVAHDMNNILGPILILPQLIGRRINRIYDKNPTEFKKIERDLAMIISSAERGASVIQDLITLSRRGSFVKVVLDINAIVTSCVEELGIQSNHTSQPQISVSLDLDDKVWPIVGSETHLTRVFDNLLRNALEAMSDEMNSQIGSNSKELTIRTYNQVIVEPYHGHETVPKGNYLVVQISDTGEGIDEHDIQRIFEPFFSKKKERGHASSGLGLSIVHGIIKDHNGFIDVKSHIGNYTIFKLFFPSLANREENDFIKQDIQSKNYSILVVDDEIGQRYLAQNTLSELGYRVTSVSSGREAFALFQRAKMNAMPSPFDLVILDMIMEEDFDGLTTYRSIQNLYPEQKVVITSGYAATHRVKIALQLGASWLSKPYDLSTLTQVVQEKINE